jgi:hypothetical protein
MKTMILLMHGSKVVKFLKRKIKSEDGDVVKKKKLFCSFKENPYK